MNPRALLHQSAPSAIAIATWRDFIGCAANPDAEMMRCQRAGRDRMVHPLVTFGVPIALRAERSVVGLSLGALVDQRTLRARERRGLDIAFQKILAQLGAHELQHETQVANDRVIAQYRTFGLHHVVQADARQQQAERKPPAALAEGKLCEGRQQPPYAT